MSELDLIIKSIQAAKSANLASLHALTAVEQMLQASTPQSNEKPLEQPESEPEGCQHENALPVITMAGNFRLCECGEQLSD